MNRRPFGAVLAVLVLAAGACVAPVGAGEPGRFDIHRAPVWTAGDTVRIATPETRGWNRVRAYIDDQWLQPADRFLALRRTGRPRDLNSLDEVPASTWFTPRPEIAPPALRARFDARRAPAEVRLEHGAPLQVLDARLDGPDPYLVVRDARGGRYWLDFDAPGAPGRRTAAAVVSSRLLRQAGYPVLDCGVDAVARGELVLAPEAGRTGEFGGRGDLRAADLDRFMAAHAGSGAGGAVRVAASRLPAGTALGSWRERGVRGDDANDRIDHRDRRSLRALRVLAAWIDFDAFREDRTLDLHLQPQGYVAHYIRGLARTLGAGPDAAPEGFGALLAPGFAPVEWAPRDPCAGFDGMQWGDALWGVRQLLAVTPDRIRAAVQAARLEDPDQEAFLARALLERRDRVARAWLDLVNGAGDFRVRESAPGRWLLECQDLGVQAGLRAPEDVSYLMRLPDADAESRVIQIRGGGRLAFDLTPVRPASGLHEFDARRYALAELTGWDARGRSLAGTVRVHLYFDRETGPRVVGVERD